MRIVLASGSAARRAMLKAAGVAFEGVVPDVDEAAVKARGGTAREIALELARQKSLEVSSSLPFMGRVETKRSEVRGGEFPRTSSMADDPHFPHPARFACRPSP